MLKKHLLSLVIFLGFVLICFLFNRAYSLFYLQQLLNTHHKIAIPIFVLSYILLTVFLFPASALTLLSGVMFGPLLGGLLSLIAATIGATIATCLAKIYLMKWVAHKFPRRMENFIHGVDEEGWRFVAFIRLVPLVPFNISNYLFGLTNIRLSTYFFTSLICMAPGAYAYAYLGFIGSNVASSHDVTTLIQQLLYGLALVALLVLLPAMLIKKIRKK